MNLFEQFQILTAKKQAEAVVSGYAVETQPKTTYFKYKIYAQLASAIGTILSYFSIYTGYYSLIWIFDFVPMLQGTFIPELMSVITLLLIELSYERIVAIVFFDFKNGEFRNKLTGAFQTNLSLYFAIFIVGISFGTSIYGGFLRKNDVSNQNEISFFDTELKFNSDKKTEIQQKFEAQKQQIEKHFDAKIQKIDSVSKQEMSVVGAWNPAFRANEKFRTVQKMNLEADKRKQLNQIDLEMKNQIDLLLTKEKKVNQIDFSKQSDKIGFVSYANIFAEIIKMLCIIFVAWFKYQSVKDSSELGLLGEMASLFIPFNEQVLNEKANFYKSILNGQQQPSPIFVGQQQPEVKKPAGFRQGSMFETPLSEEDKAFFKMLYETKPNFKNAYQYFIEGNESKEMKVINAKFNLNNVEYGVLARCCKGNYKP